LGCGLPSLNAQIVFLENRRGQNVLITYDWARHAAVPTQSIDKELIICSYIQNNAHISKAHQVSAKITPRIFIPQLTSNRTFDTRYHVTWIACGTTGAGLTSKIGADRRRCAQGGKQ
jgi:hypothetical protein